MLVSEHGGILPDIADQVRHIERRRTIQKEVDISWPWDGVLVASSRIGSWQKGRSLFVMKRDQPSANFLGTQNTANNSGSLYLIPQRDLGGPKRDLVSEVSITSPFFEEVRWLT